MVVTSVNISAESLWYVDHQSKLSDDVIHELVVEYNKQQADVLLLTMLWENIEGTNWHNYFCTLINTIRQSNPNVKIILIINSWFKWQEEILKSAGVNEIIFLDFFMLVSYIRLIKNKESVLSNWNTSASKFLFLTGKPQKLNRVRLLYKLLKAELLHNCQWSLFIHNKTLEEKCNKLIPELSSEEFTAFTKEYNTTPDNIIPWVQPNSFHYSGIPYDVSIYSNSLFQIISETGFGYTKNPWITEKIWLSIFNKMPFIVAGEYNTLAKLKAMGFKTFEKYLLVTDYDRIQNSEERLNAIVSNTKYWLTNIQTHQLEIFKDIEHNFNLITQLSLTNYSSIQDMININNLNYTVDDVIGMNDSRF
jgi:hypothetical protein|tara:strand:- start:1467 stop:2555 length:1089 start_codon:yes stop_codon:yes gene_type:complete